MAYKDGIWVCESVDDCFQCPYKDCVNRERFIDGEREINSRDQSHHAAPALLRVYDTEAHESMIFRGKLKTSTYFHVGYSVLNRCINTGKLLRNRYQVTKIGEYKQERPGNPNGRAVTLINDSTKERHAFAKVRDAAEFLGVTTNMFYYNFKNKEIYKGYRLEGVEWAKWFQRFISTQRPGER